MIMQTKGHLFIYLFIFNDNFGSFTDSNIHYVFFLI